MSGHDQRADLHADINANPFYNPQMSRRRAISGTDAGETPNLEFHTFNSEEIKRHAPDENPGSLAKQWLPSPFELNAHPQDLKQEPRKYDSEIFF